MKWENYKTEVASVENPPLLSQWFQLWQYIEYLSRSSSVSRDSPNIIFPAEFEIDEKNKNVRVERAGERERDGGEIYEVLGEDLESLKEYMKLT